MTTVTQAKAEFDIKNILTPNKFIPVYLERKNLTLSQLPPYSVELHLTSHCNYNCYHCSYRNRNKSGQKLEFGKIKALIDDLVEFKPKGVYFSGGGEPTTLVGWDSYMERLMDAGIEVALITNGSLIQPKHLKTVSRLNYIAVSIYSTKETVYQQITGGNSFDCGFYLPRMIKGNNGNCVIGARCVINHYNFTEIVAIYHRAIASGYDYVIFIPEIDYERKGIVLSGAEIDVLIKQVEEQRFEINATNTNLLRLVESKFGYYRKEESKETSLPCQAIALRTNLFVNYDGSLYLCQPHIGNQNFCIGNLNEAGLTSLWNSGRHREVIGKLGQEWSLGRCENCRSIAFSKAAERFEQLESNCPVEIVKDGFL